VCSGHNGSIAKLILVNGPPGVGKSTLARRYVDDQPLTLLLEIDALRVSIGGWEQHEESKLLARDLAIAMAETHLRGGHDVIIPQYLGRIEFIESLDRLARRLGSSFVEIVLVDGLPAVVDRFRSRRDDLVEADRAHPEGDVDESSVQEAIAASVDRLSAVEAVRVHTHRIVVTEGTEVAYRALSEVLGDADQTQPNDRNTVDFGDKVRPSDDEAGDERRGLAGNGLGTPGERE
jgi:predicted kinase